MPPPDFKFFVFDGRPVMIQVDLDRFAGHRRSLSDPAWQRLPAALALPEAGNVARPALLPQMLEVAAELGHGFDFMRVDLYTDDAQVFFGEFTPYPGSGLERFRPRSFDAWLGAQWRLPVVSAS